MKNRKKVITRHFIVFFIVDNKHGNTVVDFTGTNPFLNQNSFIGCVRKTLKNEIADVIITNFKEVSKEEALIWKK